MSGNVTCHHRDVSSVLDLVIVDHTAVADMIVLPAHSELDYFHHAVACRLSLPAPSSIAPSSTLSPVL